MTARIAETFERISGHYHIIWLLRVHDHYLIEGDLVG